MKFTEGKANLAIILVATLIYVAIPVFCPITFLKMDDYLLLWLNSGTYTGEPTAMTICSGYLYGSFITLLYRITGVVEWYTLMQFILMYVSYICLLQMVLHSSLKRIAQYAVVLAIYALQVYYELQPHFSTISVYLSITSVLLIYFSKNKPAWIIALILFFFAAQIRLMAALIPFMVMAPIFIIYDLHRKEFRTHFIYLTMCFAMALLTWGVDKAAYSSEIWQEGKTHEEMRAYFIDNDYRYQMLESIENKDDKERFELLASYRLIDPVIMDFDNLAEYRTITKKLALTNYSGSIKSYVAAFRGEGATFIIPFVLLVIILLIKYKDKKGIGVLLFSLFLCAAGSCYMMLRSDAKGRYLFPMVILLLVESIFFLFKHKPKYANIATLFFALLFGYRYGNQLHPRMAFNQERLGETEIVELIDSYHDTERVFQIHGAYHFPNAFKANGHTWGKRVYQFGMLIVSPFFGQDNTCLSVVAKGTPILCLKDDNRVVELLDQAMKRDYHKSTEVKVLASSENYKIVQIVPFQ
jgi:hypothetical protein